MELIRQEGLYAKMSICFFIKNEIKYLGYVVHAKGITIDLKRIKMIRKWKTLVNEVLGFASFCQINVLNFSKLADRIIKEFNPKLTHWARKENVLALSRFLQVCNISVVQKGLLDKRFKENIRGAKR